MLKDATNRRRQTMDFSRDFEIEPEEDAGTGKYYGPAEIETDPHKLQKRQKQIDYGKNTLGYTNYCDEVPRSKRGRDHPRTPDKRKVCSKRAFEGLLKAWRRRLHEWDPTGAEGDCAQPLPDPSLPATTTPATTAATDILQDRLKDESATGLNGIKSVDRDGGAAVGAQQSSVGGKRTLPEPTEGAIPKAPRTHAAGRTAGQAEFQRLPPLRPSQSHETAAETAAETIQKQEQAVERSATGDEFVWEVDNLPEDGPEVEYEIDDTWDEDEVGL